MTISQAIAALIVTRDILGEDGELLISYDSGCAADAKMVAIRDSRAWIGEFFSDLPKGDRRYIYADKETE
jgi:hypothetical protein